MRRPEIVLREFLEPRAPGLLEGLRAARRKKRHLVWTVSGRRMLRERRAPETAEWLVARANATGLAFVHAARTAGTSVGHAIYGDSVEHWEAAELRELAPESFERWLKFSIVRDPIERFLSAFDYARRPMDTPDGLDRAYLVKRFMGEQPDVNRFVQRFAQPRFRRSIDSWYFFRRQCHYVLDSDGQLLVNRLVPFERVSEDVPLIIGHALPKLNAAPGSRTRCQELSDASVAILKDFYAPDFALHRFALDNEGDVFGKRITGARCSR